ncbi:MAG TPA: ArgR family transcriptional regulator [Spirochaetia bacterium]|nr:ArgR family transcriptional regulator [Spirochaetia bacterium]
MNKYSIGARRRGTKGERLSAIRRIIARGAVRSQETLITLLRREGFVATQATLSRDLKRLGIGKAPQPDGGYVYVVASEELAFATDQTFVQDFARGFVSLEFSERLGVIHTLPGHANSVAAALDHMRVSEILGTIAGDDTILVLPRTGVSPSRLVKAMKARIPGFQGGE